MTVGCSQSEKIVKLSNCYTCSVFKAFLTVKVNKCMFFVVILNNDNL